LLGAFLVGPRGDMVSHLCLSLGLLLALSLGIAWALVVGALTHGVCVGFLGAIAWRWKTHSILRRVRRGRCVVVLRCDLVCTYSGLLGYVAFWACSNG